MTDLAIAEVVGEVSRPGLLRQTFAKLASSPFTVVSYVKKFDTVARICAYVGAALECAKGEEEPGSSEEGGLLSLSRSFLYPLRLSF